MLRGWGWKEGCAALADFFMPRRCIVCRVRLALRERHLCIGCLADLPETRFSGLSRNPMADRFNALIQRDLDLSDPQSGHEEYAFATALFYYRASTGYRKITQRLKYHADFAAGRFFSRKLGDRMASFSLYKGIDWVVPVPLHWSRRWSRGYNQADVIAKELAFRLGARLRTDVLCRPSRTRSQARLSVEEKVRNVSGAFRIRKRFLRKLRARTANQPNLPRRILLVDDVFTTGATLYSCFQALRTVFPVQVRIDVATLACVGQ